MKIRQAFVSNSSSSSFCIMGASSDDINVPDSIDDIGGFCEDNDIPYSYGISEFYEQYVVGLSVEEMKDNETLLDFKKRALTEIQKIDPKAELKTVGWCVDGGRDG